MTEIEPPVCYRNRDGMDIFDPESTGCQNCPFFLMCGAHLGHIFYKDRTDFIKQILIEGHSHLDDEVIQAVMKQYSCSREAARAAVRRVKDKLA